MTARRSPDGQIYTEVPVVPRHDQLDGRSLGNSHPIAAITGLQEALDAKADAVDGGNLVTDEEKAIIATVEANAQENVIEAVKVNGAALTPDASKAVDVTVPTAYGKTLAYSASSGKLALKAPAGSTLSEVTIPRKGLTALALNGDTKALTATLQDGSTVSVDLSDAADPYTAGDGLALEDGEFSLSASTASLLTSVSSHLSDQTGHVSAADRTKWNSADTTAVKLTGAQTIAGSKTFSSPVSVATPVNMAHAATKGYVDGAMEAAVHLTGDETIEGSKTFTEPLGAEYGYDYASEEPPVTIKVEDLDIADWKESGGRYGAYRFPLVRLTDSGGEVIAELKVQLAGNGSHYLIYTGVVGTPTGIGSRTATLARFDPED